MLNCSLSSVMAAICRSFKFVIDKPFVSISAKTYLQFMTIFSIRFSNILTLVLRFLVLKWVGPISVGN